MGVSIEMRPGTVMRSKGAPVDVTPGMRSKAAKLIQERFGKSPCELDRDHIEALRAMADGASIYMDDDENIWLRMLKGIEEHDCIVVSLNY